LVSYSRISSTYCFLFRFNYSNAIYSTLIFQICLNKPNLLFLQSSEIFSILFTENTTSLKLQCKKIQKNPKGPF
jgi:hypothetical protein